MFSYITKTMNIKHDELDLFFYFLITSLTHVPFTHIPSIKKPAGDHPRQD